MGEASPEREGFMVTEKTRARLARSAPGRQAKQVVKAFGEFTRLEAAGGIILIAAAVIALPGRILPGPKSTLTCGIRRTIQIGVSLFPRPAWWINESLMVIFFFVVGLN
jgi:NhaA family Na+:H+ antiporter